MANFRFFVLVFLLTGCGGAEFDAFGAAPSTTDGRVVDPATDGGVGGAATVGDDAGSGGAGGSAGGREAVDSGGEAADASDASRSDASFACPSSMMQGAGAYCIDKQPALLANGEQGLDVSWSDANAICAGRGARLCTQEEREAACPGGQVSSNSPNQLFCNGPAATWEWSATACSGPGHCRTPCCNSVLYPCVTDACDAVTAKSSYHCCKDQGRT